MNRRAFIWIGLVIAFLPILISMGAGWFASAHGCQLNEGSPSPCIVNGKDYAGTLYGLGLSFLYMFITIPVGGIIAAIGFIKKTPVVTNGMPAQNARPAKNLIWTGVGLIFIPPILQTVLSLLISTIGSAIMPLYAMIAIIGPLAGFASMFCVPLGIVLLIVGIVRYFKNRPAGSNA